jgi:3-hydroxyacyl-[acyl-carrier-protein] dehydratase
MRLLYVDQVTRLSRLQSIRAELHLSAADPIFAIHFPSHPMLPASALIESFAQAGTILLEASFEFRRKAIPAFIRSAKFHRPVTPDSHVEIHMRVDQCDDEAALLQGRANQAGVTCASCTMGMVTAPIENFYGSEQSQEFRSMYARWLKGAVLDGFNRSPLESLEHALAR